MRTGVWGPQVSLCDPHPAATAWNSIPGAASFSLKFPDATATATSLITLCLEFQQPAVPSKKPFQSW